MPSKTRRDLPAWLRAAMARMAWALRSRVARYDHGPTRAALEITRNAASVLVLDPDLDVAAVLQVLLVQRVDHLGLQCDGVTEAATAGAEAWRGCDVERMEA